MKNSILIVVVIASLAANAPAQDKSPTSSAEQARHTAMSISSKPLTVAGKVSSDGKTLVTDIDSEWDITNPEALKGYEGSRVTAKCYVDTLKSQIQIIRVKKEDEPKYASKHGDSAFRR
jgi:hypothetical protein